MKYLVFPLGNKGEKYEKTRHNAGKFVFGLAKNNPEIKNFLERGELSMFNPDCFMNESGIYLKEYLKNKNFDLENLIVIYDDKDLEIGDVRRAKDRGDGGHNGLKDIIENLGTKNFHRIRIGIAPKGTGKNDLIPPHGEIVQKYVLGKMTEEEIEILKSERLLERVTIFIEDIVNNK